MWIDTLALHWTVKATELQFPAEHMITRVPNQDSKVCSWTKLVG